MKLNVSGGNMKEMKDLELKRKLAFELAEKLKTFVREWFDATEMPDYIKKEKEETALCCGYVRMPILNAEDTEEVNAILSANNFKCFHNMPPSKTYEYKYECYCENCPAIDSCRRDKEVSK